MTINFKEAPTSYAFALKEKNGALTILEFTYGQYPTLKSIVRDWAECECANVILVFEEGRIEDATEEAASEWYWSWTEYGDGPPAYIPAFVKAASYDYESKIRSVMAESDALGSMEKQHGLFKAQVL